MMKRVKEFLHEIDMSAGLTVCGIILLFSSAILVTMIAPRHLDSTWIQPSSVYQVQMYEVADPNLYISRFGSDSDELQSVYHLKKDYSLLAFQESETLRILAKDTLKKYVTRFGESTLKLTSRLMMLRPPLERQKEQEFQKALQKRWEEEHPKYKEEGQQKPVYDILELFEVEGVEAFAVAPTTDRFIENWVDENFEIVDTPKKAKWHEDAGVIFINNPTEYRVEIEEIQGVTKWHFDPEGVPVKNLDFLKSLPLGFRSRKELIDYGEHLYAIEGCWYCHTDQTRTLVQDVVLNGSEAYPAPPSSANEYIYEKITFPGTRRIGPDLSRVGVKRSSRDWHKSHFWSPKTASKGSIMPAFQHFFDDDPRGKGRRETGIPDYQFEAVFQYLMTKGTRITPPTKAWWLGKDPINTKAIIEGAAAAGTGAAAAAAGGR